MEHLQIDASRGVVLRKGSEKGATMGSPATIIEDDLKGLAKSMARERLDDPQYQHHGMLDLTLLVQSIVNDLGHNEWLTNDVHWIWDVVSAECP